MATAASPAPGLADAIPGSELQALLFPIGADEFVHRYWGREPLYLRGDAAKVRGFFDGEAFREALAQAGPPGADVLRASFDAKTDDGRSASALAGEQVSSVFRASLEQAVPLFRAGATLCLSQVERRVPRLARFLAAIKRQLGYPGRASFSAYLSPPGSGFNWHFDARIASTLQIEGRKRWRYTAHAATPWPRGNGSLDAAARPRYTDPGCGPSDELVGLGDGPVGEVTLEPGDLLVLPAGVWHEACGGDEGSLALNLSFTPLPYTLLAQRLLDALLMDEPGWRSMNPALPAGPAGEIDAAGVAAISAQLARAASALQALSGDSAQVLRLWQSLVGGEMPPATPVVAGPAPVLPMERLRLRAEAGVHAMLAEQGAQLLVATGEGRRLELSGDAVAFVRRLLSTPEFTAASCLEWTGGGAAFAWDDVAGMLGQLRSQGLIESV